MSDEEIIFQKFNDYSVKLKQIDKEHVTESKRRKDGDAPAYGPGWGWYKENPSVKEFGNFVFGAGNCHYDECDYINLGGIPPTKLKQPPKIDIFAPSGILNLDKHIGMEYKKLRQFYNNGLIDEYTFKKLVNLTPAIYGWKNPFTGDSTISDSFMGDIERLTILPDSIIKSAFLEYWANSKYDEVTRTYFNMIDEYVCKYYNVKKYEKKLEGMSTNYNDTCYLLAYIVYGRK
tara:strand:- start:1564 stop:2259 length:696 start_codon:yes stop_codon:yes gene_type:complete